MFNVFQLCENILERMYKIFKILYWKIKYGKRIKIGKGFYFRKGLIINIAKDGQLVIGEDVFFNNYCSINVHNKITIGNKNIFGENVKVYDHDHAFYKRNFISEFYNGEVAIGENNWFGSNVVILRKAKIGDNNVIGAGVIFNEIIKNNNLVKYENMLNIKKFERR